MGCKQKYSEKAFQKAVLTIKGPKPLNLGVPRQLRTRAIPWRPQEK